MATIKVIKNNNIKNGYIVRHDELHGPAVATGTTVTSAYSSDREAIFMEELVPLIKLIFFPCIPEYSKIKKQ